MNRRAILLWASLAPAASALAAPSSAVGSTAAVMAADGAARRNVRVVEDALRVVFSEHRVDQVDTYFAEDFVQYSIWSSAPPGLPAPLGPSRPKTVPAPDIPLPAGSQASGGGQSTQRVLIVTPPRARPPARAAARTQKCDHMFSWISLASRSLL